LTNVFFLNGQLFTAMVITLFKLYGQNVKALGL